MRLGFIIPGSLGNQSGGFLYDRMLVEHLRSRGCRVEVLPVRWGSYAGDLLRNVPRRLPPGFDPGSLDLLLEDELSHPALLSFNRWVRRELDLPIVSVVHHLRSSEAWPACIHAVYRRIERTYLAHVDGAVCNSQATRRNVEALWPEPRPCIIARPGRGRLESRITAGQVRARALRPGPLKLIFLGNIIPRKGLHTLFTALAAIDDQDWQLDVIGDPTVDPGYVRRSLRFIARHRLDHKVRFLGRLDDASLPASLSDGHLMVMPSDYEGFGIAYLDGMAFGLPAVATTAGGAGEIVRDDYNGLLLTPGDVDGLVGGLTRLGQDRHALAEMGIAALETYRHHPTWSESLELVRTFVTGFERRAGRSMTAGSQLHHHTIVGGSA